MRILPFLTATILVALPAISHAADVATIPSEPIAKKKEVLFKDNFKGTTHDKLWHDVVETFAFEPGYLKGTQTRDHEIKDQDGKVTVTPHAAVYGLELPTHNSVIECKIRFEGASLIDVEFDDRKFTGSHYGHLCRAQIKLDRVIMIDERDGTQSNALIELRKDPVANKAVINKLISDHMATYPIALQAHKWYRLCVETVEDEMRVTIDGKPAGYLKSAGIGHVTKSKIEFGVNGKDGWYTDLKVWNAEPADVVTEIETAN